MEHFELRRLRRLPTVIELHFIFFTVIASELIRTTSKGACLWNMISDVCFLIFSVVSFAFGFLDVWHNMVSKSAGQTWRFGNIDIAHFLHLPWFGSPWIQQHLSGPYMQYTPNCVSIKGRMARKRMMSWPMKRLCSYQRHWANQKNVSPPTIPSFQAFSSGQSFPISMTELKLDKLIVRNFKGWRSLSR